MDAMRYFLSEENLTIHKRELGEARARLAIYEKSLPAIKGKGVRHVRSMRMDGDYKREILRLKRYIMLHEVFFSSFSDKPHSPHTIKKYYPSRDSFIFECKEKMLSEKQGFLCFFKTKDAPLITVLDENSPSLFEPPLLAVDISEHAYFLDYAFERGRYFSASLERLKLSILFE